MAFVCQLGNPFKLPRWLRSIWPRLHWSLFHIQIEKIRSHYQPKRLSWQFWSDAISHEWRIYCLSVAWKTGKSEILTPTVSIPTTNIEWVEGKQFFHTIHLVTSLNSEFHRKRGCSFFFAIQERVLASNLNCIFIRKEIKSNMRHAKVSLHDDAKLAVTQRLFW